MIIFYIIIDDFEKMKKIFTLIMLTIFLSGCVNTGKQNTNNEFTFLITMDGVSASHLEKLNPNTINYLIKENGAKYSFNSETVCPSITTLAHASLFTGADPKIHGFLNPGDDLKSKTIFEIFEKNDYKTLLLDGKGGRIKGLEKNVSYYIGNKKYTDNKNANVEIINDFLINFEKYKPTFSFILLPEADIAGHEYGSESKEYSQAIINNDNAINTLINYLKKNNIFEKSNIIITSDHGMTEKDHDSCLGDDLKIPIIKYGEYFKNTPHIDQNIKDISKEILDIYNLKFD